MRKCSVPLFVLVAASVALVFPRVSVAAGAVPAQGIEAVGSHAFQIISDELPARFPADFPFPANYTIAAVNDDGDEISFILNVPSANAAYEFFKEALPRAGFQINDEGAIAIGDIGFIGGLEFSNEKYTGHIGGTVLGLADTQSLGIDLAPK